MSAFPLLNSGAVMQYPALRDLVYSTEVLQFLDGGEQRFPHYGSPLRRWGIELSGLDEEELGRLEAFYVSAQGDYGAFAFTDPFDGTEYPHCCFENGEVLAEFLEIHQGRTRLIVRQSR